MNNYTLDGGRTLTASFADGTSKEIFIRQIPVRDHRAGLKFLDDEFKLVAFCLEWTEDEVLNLTPESYEAVQAAVWEVNAKGFFVYGARQVDRVKKQLESLSPELLKLEMERLTRLQSQSPTSPPRRG